MAGERVAWGQSEPVLPEPEANPDQFEAELARVQSYVVQQQPVEEPPVAEPPVGEAPTLDDLFVAPTLLSGMLYAGVPEWEWVPGGPGGPIRQPASPVPAIPPSTAPSVWGDLETDPTKRGDLHKPLERSEQFEEDWQGANPVEVSSLTGYDAELATKWDLNGDGQVTRAELRAFNSDYRKDIEAAERAYEAYLTANPNADAASREAARNAALLSANRSLFTTGSNFTPSDLASGANNTVLVPEEVREAARFFSNPGMFRQIDNAGNNPVEVRPDQRVDSQNLNTWIANFAPRNPMQFASMLDQAAAYNLVKDVQLTPDQKRDIVKNPGNYTAEQRARAAFELTELRQIIAIIDDSAYWAYWDDVAEQAGLDPNRAKAMAELDKAIDKLMNGIGDRLLELRAPHMKTIIDADPDIQQGVREFYDSHIKTGNITIPGLGDVPIYSKVEAYVTIGYVYHYALGGTGAPDLRSFISQNPGTVAQIQDYYRNNLANGNLLTDLLSKTNTPEQAIIAFGGIVAQFNTLLDPAFVDSQKAGMQAAVKTALQGWVENQSIDPLVTMLSNPDGTLNEDMLRQIYDELLKQDSPWLRLEDGTQINWTQYLASMRGDWDMIRQGGKFPDAYNKIVEKANQLDTSATYKKGYLHLISALMSGAIFASRTPGFNNTPASIVGGITNGMTFAGVLMEGSAKWGKTLPAGSQWKLSDGVLGNIENSGKLIGGFANLISGLFGIITGSIDVSKGNPLAGGLSITGGILSVLAGGLSSAEAIAGFAGALPRTIGFIGVGASVVGWVAAAFAAAGFMVWQIMNDRKTIESLTNVLRPIANEYDIAPRRNGDPNDFPTPRDPLIGS